jgi:hypothetical protein
MRLSWTAYEDVIFGPSYQLEGLQRASDCGVAHRQGKRFVACATINGCFMSHEAGRILVAIERLNRELDRRSIGLFGDDELSFD